MSVDSIEPVQKGRSIPKFLAIPCEWTAKSHRYLTPREVSRRVLWLSRGELSRRRNLGLRPDFVMLAGCVMYHEAEIELFLMEGSCDLAAEPFDVPATQRAH